MKYPLVIKSVYNFSMYASSILGVGYTGATVMAIMDYDSAKSLQDVNAIHSQVLASLPNGTPRNAGDLTYIKIKTSTGEIRVIAEEWLLSEPVLLTNTTLVIKVYNTSASDHSLLRDILVQNGFNTFSIETAV